MSTWQYVIIIVFALVLVIGIAFGLYLSRYSTELDDEDYEMEAYFDEKWDRFGPTDKGK